MLPGGVQMDFVLNGQGHGNVASALLRNNMDVGALRPFIGDDGQNYITVNDRGQERTIVTNAPASLRFQDWRLIDEAVIKVAKPRLRAVGDLRGAGLEVSLANGMGYTVFSYENQSDISPASINMDGIVRGESDRPVFDIINLPMPIIHKDFDFSARQVMASRNGYSPLDVTTAELAARRVAEGAEQLLLGVWPTYTFGGGTVYGYTNFNYRMTKTMTAPTAGGWTPSTLIQEILAMRLQSQLEYHFGPWMLYTSPNWDQYLDEDYSAAKGDNTIRQRIRDIEGIMDCRTVDYLQFLPSTPYTMIMVEFQPEVIREVVAMDVVTMQWETHGGMQMNFKVMCIMVPQLRADQNQNTGIVHGSASYP